MIKVLRKMQCTKWYQTIHNQTMKAIKYEIILSIIHI